jgi:hypothetical protein
MHLSIGFRSSIRVRRMLVERRGIKFFSHFRSPDSVEQNRSREATKKLGHAGVMPHSLAAGRLGEGFVCALG